MPTQNSLFSEDAPGSTASPASNVKTTGQGVALSALQFTDGTLSPEQKRFNKLLAQTETLARKIETVQALADAHRAGHWGSLRPLEEQRSALMRDMALWLDQRLQKKGLSAKQKRMATEILCSLAASLAMAGDETMQHLHDAHNDVTMADQEKAATADMQDLMEEMLGQPLARDQEFDSLEALLQASMAQMRQQTQEAQDAAKSANKARRKTSAREQQATQQTQEADGALRTIYRQLVSALHPDRENDPHERDRKTGLMKEVNAAYERRDLLTLLQLQLQAALADGDMVANLAREKLVSLTVLLKERVGVLTQELYDIEMRTREEFEMERFDPLSAGSLKRHLRELQQDLQYDIAMMTRDLQQVQNDAEFKRWLKEQHEPAPRQFNPFEVDPFF